MAVVCSLALVVPSESAATEYSAQPIKARVIDATSRKPIEGAVVVAHWQLEGGIEGGNVLGQLMVLETTSNEVGEFSFPPWGPISVPPGLPANARLKDHDPELVIFKSGYRFVHLQNTKQLSQMRSAAPYTRRSDWDAKTIEMTPMPTQSEAALRDFSFLNSFLGFATHRMSPCAWMSMPKMIQAVHEHRKLLEAIGRKLLTQSVDQELSDSQYFLKAGCGNPNDVFGERLK